MSWRVEFAPEVERDVAEAAQWYELQQPGLGKRLLEEIIQIWDELADNPLLSCRRHPTRNVRWRYPEHYPYRIIYEVDEAAQTVKVAAVLHGAHHERHWKKRVNH